MNYRYLLVPGRHHAITRFQIEHLQALLSDNKDRRAEVIWAITSANHEGTQRNPLSGSRRLGIIEAVAAREDLPSQVYQITNMSQKPHFAHFLIEEIRLQSRGRVTMTPENTLVVTSTKAVADQYRELGYEIDTAETDSEFRKVHHSRPWDVVEELIKGGADWRASAIVRDELHPVCYEEFERYGLGDQIVEIFQDPLINSDDGDITSTRDYATYRQAFEDGAARKVSDFSQYVQPGRILDVGCATGETLKLLSAQSQFFESDFYGIEAARPLYQICQQRKDAGEFGDANVFFYQRNIMRSSLFAHNSLDTIITMALTHEVESYLGRQELIAFIQRMYDTLKPGGVYINYDVVGPNDRAKIVYALFNDQDGANPESVHEEIDQEHLSDYLRSLSTLARFRRFMSDFRKDEGEQIGVMFETIDGKQYAALQHMDLCDFLAKKDYFNSWTSEMHERFCFWEYSDWVEALQKVGFTIQDGSEAKQNPWLIENRFAPAASVFVKRGDELIEIEQPVTNILVIASK